MASYQISETCAEHKIRVADDGFQKVQRLKRAQWLRAAILGANDGLLSTTSIMLGVGAAKEDRQSMILSGLAGALAGACSMAVGEFVSVSTQRDIERATISQCSSKTYGEDADGNKVAASPQNSRGETNLGEASLSITPFGNINCSKLIYESVEKMSPAMILEPRLPPGMSPGRSPAMKVIQEDAKKSSGILQDGDGEEVLTNPYKAAVASGLSFLIGSFVPLVPAILVARNVVRIGVIVLFTSIALALFGGFGAYLGGSPARKSAARIVIGGWIAMAITYGLLKPFDNVTSPQVQ